MNEKLRTKTNDFRKRALIPHYSLFIIHFSFFIIHCFSFTKAKIRRAVPAV